jgi:hypothetical protein
MHPASDINVTHWGFYARQIFFFSTQKLQLNAISNPPSTVRHLVALKLLHLKQFPEMALLISYSDIKKEMGQRGIKEDMWPDRGREES